MAEPPKNHLVSLNVDQPVMVRAFTVAPLVLIGTREEDGGYDLAPKHMVTPLGWENYFGFVCTPRHRTYHNAKREGAFTVSYPRPRQVVLASLAAGPRCDDGSKPSLESLATFPATEVDGVFIEEAFFFLECTLHQVVDGFGENSLVAGRIVAAHIDPAALRMHDRDDSDVVHRAPLLAYLDPGRFARIEKSYSFPFMADYKK